MPAPVRAVVFDLDGTLIDSRGDIVAALNQALGRGGLRQLPAAVIVRFVGDGARALCARAAGVSEHDAAVEPILTAFLEYYQLHPVDFSRWMPHAQEALESLAQIPGVALGLCTNKARPVTDAILSALGVTTRFRAIVAGGDLPEKKPSPVPLLHLATALGVSPGEMVMVGDGPQDIESAHAAGVRSVGIEGGFTSVERLRAARPDLLLPDLSRVSDVIARWSEATARHSRASWTGHE